MITNAQPNRPARYQKANRLRDSEIFRRTIHPSSLLFLGLPFLLRQTSFNHGTCQPGPPASFRLDERPGNKVAETRLAFVAVGPLRPMHIRPNEQLVISRAALPGKFAQPGGRAFGQAHNGIDRDAKLHPRVHLVHGLPARTAGPRKREVDGVARDPAVRAHNQRISRRLSRLAAALRAMFVAAVTHPVIAPICSFAAVAYLSLFTLGDGGGGTTIRR